MLRSPLHRHAERLKGVDGRLNALLVVSFIGGVLAVDNRSSLRLMLSQPIIGGLLVGLALRAPDQGLFVGMMFQVMFLGYVHIRGERIPDLPVGGVAASALYILSVRQLGGGSAHNGLILFLSILGGLLVSLLGYGFYRVWERASWNLADRAMRNVVEGRLHRAAAIHMSALAFHFAYGVLILLATIPAGVAFVASVSDRLGTGLGGTLHALQYLVPFIGVGSLARLHFVRSRAFWFGAGFLVSYVFLVFR
jgi:mannose/fructose/N-acetylgalactosamine-specific phosphotransferase system component IIC